MGLCIRIQEELKKVERATREYGESMTTVIEATFSTAGFTVTLSGITLACSFAVLMFVPVTLLQNLGVGCTISLCITVLSANTVPAALLGAFPAFFGKSGTFCRKCCEFGITEDDQLKDAGSTNISGASTMSTMIYGDFVGDSSGGSSFISSLAPCSGSRCGTDRSSGNNSQQ